MWEKLTDTFGGFVMLVAALAYGLGGVVGAIYWAINDDLLNVVLSVFIPFYGAISVIWSLLQ